MTQKAPGRCHRKGISLVQLTRMFPDDKASEKWFIKQRWGTEVTCPHCKSVNIQEGTTHPTMPFRCRKCRKFFSVRTKTVMQGSPLGYQTWLFAIYLMATNIKGVSSMKLHRDLGITQKAAWHMAHRIRKSWSFKIRDLTGPVEVDETYIGGKESNKHESKKLKAGRGTVGKTPVIGMKDRPTKLVVARPSKEVNQEIMKKFTFSHIQPWATIYTDESRVYSGFPNHESVKHSAKEYVRGMVSTNGIDSFWSMLKRGQYGIYHHMSPKHLGRYVTEFSGRQNVRDLDTIDQMAFMAKNIIGKRLPYKYLTAN